MNRENESREKLREERDRFLAFAFASGDALVELDGRHRIAFATGALAALTRGPPSEDDESPLTGQDFLALVNPNYCQRVVSALGTLAGRNRFGPLAVDLVGDNGLPVRAEINAARLPESESIFLSIRFLGPRRRAFPLAEAEMRAATGLPDKTDFADVAAHALQASYTQPQPFNISFLELKGLDELTERLEEHIATGFLNEVGENLRSFSYRGTAVAHIDSNRFGVVHDASQDVKTLEAQISDRARAADPLGAGVDVISGTMHLTGDPAMHRENAKALAYTINKFARHNDDFTLADLTRASREGMEHTVRRISALRSVIDDSAFDIAYQPIVDLEGREIHHYEALARFLDAKGESPYEQIVFAEDTGMIAEFDLAMCRRVAAKISQAAKVREELRIAVNVSGRSLESPSFLDKLDAMLQGRPELRKRLLFEVTESAKIHDLEATGRFLQHLRSKGHQVCLDDFGAGAAAFHYLRYLRVDFVKIDGVYVRDACNVPDNLSFIKAISGLCRDLSVETIAEQVEDDETVHLLRSLDVRLGQGYLLGVPQAGVRSLKARRLRSAVA